MSTVIVNPEESAEVETPAVIEGEATEVAETVADAVTEVAQIEADRDIRIAELQAEVQREAIRTAEIVAAHEQERLEWQRNIETTRAELASLTTELQLIREQSTEQRPPNSPEQERDVETPDSQEPPAEKPRRKPRLRWI